MFKTKLLRDEKIKSDFKKWKITAEQYIDKLWALYYKNKICK